MPTFNDKSIQGIIDIIHAELPCMPTISDKSIRGIIDAMLASGQTINDISIQGIIDVLTPFTCVAPIEPGDAIFQGSFVPSTGGGITYTWIVPEGVTKVDALLIGGGGGGGTARGGAAGQAIIVRDIDVIPGESMTVVAGSGGRGWRPLMFGPYNGGDSSFSGITATGGLTESVATSPGPSGSGAPVLSFSARNGMAASTSVPGLGGGGGSAAALTATSGPSAGVGGAGGIPYISITDGTSHGGGQGNSGSAAYDGMPAGYVNVNGGQGGWYGGGGGAANTPAGISDGDSTGDGAMGVVILRWGSPIP